MHAKRRRRIERALAGLCLVLAGCGDDAGDSNESADGSAAGGAGGELGQSRDGGQDGQSGGGQGGTSQGGSSPGGSGQGGTARGDSGVGVELEITGASPRIVDPLGSSRLLLSGSGFSGATSVTIGGVAVTSFRVLSDESIVVVTGEVSPGPGLDVVVMRGDETATLAAAVEAWSPAELTGARVFDANSGVTEGEDATTYEWQQLTENIGDDWIVRDGNTLNWFPPTNKFWMVGGWNGYLYPEGFDTDGDVNNSPLLNTTTEVWSSPDGATWTLELPMTHTQFERRHSHNTIYWKDKLWIVGGDSHQGWYNHDVVSSSDGVNWTVELGEHSGKPRPPWSERGLAMAGAYAGRLWMAGGMSLFGDLANQTIHNDVWSTEDGVNWTEVVPDAPPGETRWAPCGVMTQLVEFRGRMWMAGCSIYNELTGGSYLGEVWSTEDGATWRQHAKPPWPGRRFHNVVVWDEKLWVIAGIHHDTVDGWPGGNTSETWYSEDGESWTPMAWDRLQVPPSHAQGVDARADGIYYAGGNYSFGGYYSHDKDRSTWRLVAFKGKSVESWASRAGALTVRAVGAARPVRDPNGLGEGIAGLQFDGSASALSLGSPAAADVQPEGRSVFWVARAPFLHSPLGRLDDSFNPVATVVGGEVGDGAVYPTSSVGYTDGKLVYTNRAEGPDEFGNPAWEILRAGDDLQHNTGEVRFVGATHAQDGTLQAYVDGAAMGAPLTAYYGNDRGWSRIGGGMGEDGTLAVDNRFAGTLGAVVILPTAVDASTVERLHAWAQGRFGAR